MISAMDADGEETPGERGTRRVSVRKHRVDDEDWNDLAAVTRERILKLKPQPPGSCIYLNPAFTVEAPEFSAEFSQEARRCQRAWLRTMNRTLGNRNRKHFAIRADFLTRQLAHTGMLIVNGNIVPPHDWTAMDKAMTAQSQKEEPA
jgi:hypothetical protein